MIIQGKDGVTHINIYSKGKTELGRWLSNFSYSPIFVPKYGNFNSIEGLWYYLGTRDERLRDLYGFKAKQFGKSLETNTHVENFEDLIKGAIDIKLKSNIPKLRELKESNLPLCHYYEYSSKRVDAGFEWIVEHISQRRDLLKKKWVN